MSEWRSTIISEIADLFDGPHATPKKTDSGPWFLSISSLNRGRLDLGESAHLSNEDFQKWTRRVTPRHGDILFSYETRLGEAAIMPSGLQACLGRRMALLRPRQDRVDSKFLLYSYLAPEFQNVIRERTVHGATVDRIPLVDMPGWRIRLPSLSEQLAIASVLGALDGKIAVNDRITIIHEELLRARFDELQVDAEPMPGDAVRTSDLIEFNPQLPIPVSAEAVYLDMSSVSTTKATVHDWYRRSPKSGTRFANGDTVMARITPCLENGKTAFIDFMNDGEVGIGSTEFIVMRSRKGVPTHLPYFLARSPRFRSHAVLNMSGSSGRQRVGAQQLIDFPLSRPDNASLSAFEQLASVTFAHLKSLTFESRTLTQLRDILLPKLMSGEIGVRDAAKIVEDVT